MVNIREDHCFQCQESGHIACHCSSVQCFDCDEYGHILMDCPHRIPPSGTSAHHHRGKSHSSCHNRSTSHHHHKNSYRCCQSRPQYHSDWYHSKSHCDSYRGHSRSQHRDNWWHHRSSSQCPHSTTYIHHSHNDTPHHRSSTHIALQLTPEIAADYALDEPTNPPRKPHTHLCHIPADH